MLGEIPRPAPDHGQDETHDIDRANELKRHLEQLQPETRESAQEAIASISDAIAIVFARVEGADKGFTKSHTLEDVRGTMREFAERLYAQSMAVNGSLDPILDALELSAVHMQFEPGSRDLMGYSDARIASVNKILRKIIQRGGYKQDLDEGLKSSICS